MVNQMYGWMDSVSFRYRKDEWMDEWMDKCKFESFCGKSDVWMDGWCKFEIQEGRMDRWMDGLVIDGWISLR